MRTVTRSDSSVSIRKGERFRIELEALGAAGYAWTIEHAPSNLEKVGEGIRPGKRVGGAATQEFEFEAVAVGKTTLALRYGRSWESGGDLWSLDVAVE